MGNIRFSFKLAFLGAALFGLMAEDCAIADDRPVERFQVANVEPAGYVDLPDGFETPERNLERLAAALRGYGIDPDLPGVLETVQINPTAALAIERFLEDVVALYRSWGFPAPALDPIVELDDGELAYRVYLVNSLGEEFDSVNTRGFYRTRCSEGLERVILLSAGAILDDDGNLDLPGYKTLAHELFHAVQGNAPLFACRDDGAVGAWIHEGQADAVAIDALRMLRNERPPIDPHSLWGYRKYSAALPVPRTGFQDREAYGTSSWWRYLAEASVTRTPGPEVNAVDYTYLARMLNSWAVERDCDEPTALCSAEMRWLDQQTREHFGKPLREMYSLFLQAYVRYGYHRVTSRDSDFRNWSDENWWQNSFAPSCPDVELRKSDPRTGGDGIDAFVEDFSEYSTNCFRIVPAGYDGLIRLQIRAFEGEAGHPISALTAGTEGAPFVAQRPRVYLLGEDPQRTGVWEFDLITDDSTLVLLSNMPDDLTRPRKMPDIRINFRVIEEYARMAAGTDVPEIALIELDQIKMSHVIPALTPVHRRAGFVKPCAVRLLMTSSETGDGLELLMDHEGPIAPGNYVVAPREEGRPEPPEDHPNEFVVGFQLGADNVMTGGHAQVFGAESGTVTIDEFSPDLLRGSVTAVGKRWIDGKWQGDEWIDYPENLESLPLRALFSVRPRLPPGTSGPLSIESCVAGGESGPPGTAPPSGIDSDTSPETPSGTPSETSPGASSGTPPESRSGTPSAIPSGLPSGTPSTPSETGGDEDPPSGEDGEAPEDALCSPLSFSETEPFSDASELPFAFEKPAGWVHQREGATRGSIHSPDYRDGGIKYDARWVTSRSELASARGLQQAIWPKLGDVDFGGAKIEFHGGQLGDALNTYAVLPIDDRHLVLEVRFLGRQGCDMEPVTALRTLFLDSLEPK